MKIAVTGGTGFVGRHLTKRLVEQGHQVVIVSRGFDNRDPSVRNLLGVTFVPICLDSATELARAFEGCAAVAHLAGINRELGSQTYRRIHIDGTANVIEAAKQAGVGKIVQLSFLRARPNCGSAYHESKWAAEDLVRESGLDFTILKAGVIYGKGDHLLDHISHALHTFPIILLVGYRPQPMRPLAVEDLVDVLAASLIEGELSRKTVPITGPEELNLREIAERIARVVKKRPLIMRSPVWLHYAMAWVFERTMQVPLEAKAQTRILSESLVRPVGAPDFLPEHLVPKTAFTDEQIRKGLPPARGFGLRDCLRRTRSAAWTK